MSSATISSNELWSDHLLRALAELRQQLSARTNRLSDAIEADLDRLLSASAQMIDMVSAADNTISRHDMLNVLSVIKGYAELLIEDLDVGANELRAALSRLLKTVVAIERSNSQPSTEHYRVENMTEDPGCILAVDDREENRLLLTRTASMMGHKVITAASGEEALKTLATKRIDVVLLDLVMPGMGGREALRQIKDHHEWHATPVIMISGMQDMRGIIQCIETGADDYLFKPFNPVLLNARIKAGIERKRWHDREANYRAELERKEKFIRDTFGRYLSQEIVTDILEKPEGLDMGGDLREVTIMMSDIRGFTSLCEGLPATDVVKLLNRYLGAMTDIIIDHKGTIDEFLGDAILAVFGAPLRGDDDADRAVKCALAMQSAMAGVNRDNRRDGLPELACGIALNTGTVIAGNIGSKKRSKYGFVGHPMNVTARIEKHASAGSVIVSQATLDALSDQYQLGPSKTIAAKGVQDELHIHAILGIA